MHQQQPNQQPQQRYHQRHQHPRHRPSRHPVTGRLDIVAAVASYLTTLGRAPAVLHLTQRQWDTFRRDAAKRPSLGLAPVSATAGDAAGNAAGNAVGDTALSRTFFDGTRYVIPIEIVEIDRSAGVKAYRRQYEAENTPVQNHTLSGAANHA